MPLFNPVFMAAPPDYEQYPALSNSALSALDPARGGSPMKFWQTVSGGYSSSGTSSQQLGTLIHTAILEPHKLPVLTVKEPKNKMKDVLYAYAVTLRNVIPQLRIEQSIIEADFKTTTVEKVKEALIEFKPWVEAMMTNQTIINDTTRQLLLRIQQKVRDNPAARVFLDEVPGVPLMDFQWHREHSLYWNDLNLLTHCKQRVDHWTYAAGVLRIMDVKTTSSPAMCFPESAEQYDYPRQLVFYAENLVHWLKSQGLTVITVELYLLVVETIGENTCLVYKLSFETIRLAQNRLRDLIHRAMFHLSSQQFDFPMEHYQNNGIIPL